MINEASPAFKAVTGLGGLLALYIALKVGRFVLKLIFGLIGLALLAGVAWWFLARH